jgi:peptidyl-prolyl cis-trans isomerase D
MRRFTGAARAAAATASIMLKKNQNPFVTWSVRILFGLLALSFALWGIEDVLRPPSGGPVAKVGDIRISAAAFGREFDRAVQQLRTSFGPDFDAAKARQFGLDRQVLSTMVSRALFDSEVDALHLKVPDAEVANQIRANPLFQDQAGRFDRTRFDELLRQNGLTEQGFTQMLRGDLTRRQLVSAVSGGISGPESFARLLYIYRNEKRTAEVVAFPASEVKDLPAPTEDQLRAYYKAHADTFAKPEYRKIGFFVVRPEDVIAHMDIPDADLRQAYDERKASFTQPEQRDFTQMLFKTEAEADAAAKKLRDGADADTLAKAPGLIASSKVEAAQRGELLPKIGDAVFSADAKTVAGPVDSGLGWAVLRIDAVTAAHVKPFEAVRDDLRHIVAGERANEKLYQISNEIEDERAGGATMADVAKKLGVTLHTVDAIDSTGKAPDGTKVADLPDTPNFLETAFDSEADQDLDPIELPSGGYALLRVDGITPAATPPFEQVEDQVRAHQQDEAREDAVKALAEKIAKQVKAGGDLAALAKEADRPVDKLGPIARDYKGDALPPEVVRTLFAVKPHGVAVGATDDGYVVAQVTDVIPADAAKHPDGVQAIRADIASEMSEDILHQYQAALEHRFEVKVNMKAADAATGAPQG